MLTAEQYREAEFGYTLEESRKGFVVHAIVYGLVNTCLIAINVSMIAFTDAISRGRSFRSLAGASG